MAAGLVTKLVGDGLGGSFTGQFWADNTGAPTEYSPASTLIDINGNPLFPGNGVAANPSPFVAGGRDAGGVVRSVLIDTSGRPIVVGGAAPGSAAAGAPVAIGGVDGGGLVREVLTDTSGRQIAVGAVANAVSAAGINPVLVAGVSTGTNAVITLQVNPNSQLIVSNQGNNQVNQETSTNLGISATFTGGSRALAGVFVVSQWRKFIASAFTDVTGTLQIQAANSTTWRVVASVAVAASTYAELTVDIVYQNYRVVYINGAVATTILEVNSSQTST
jgi:hypothetical protein